MKKIKMEESKIDKDKIKEVMEGGEKLPNWFYDSEERKPWAR